MYWYDQRASSAVAGWPSDQFIPARILNVHDRPSADWLHDSAKPGTGSLFEPKPTSRS